MMNYDEDDFGYIFPDTIFAENDSRSTENPVTDTANRDFRFDVKYIVIEPEPQLQPTQHSQSQIQASPSQVQLMQQKLYQPRVQLPRSQPQLLQPQQNLTQAPQQLLRLQMQLPQPKLHPAETNREEANDVPQYLNCLICGDKATGKHYGAASCDGCKGFFRRSVRKSHRYLCRFAQNCVVDKDKRNQCRFCRLRKCFFAGMKKEAVQNERDRISRRIQYDNISERDMTIINLITASSLCTFGKVSPEVNIDVSNQKLANFEDVCTSMKQQLLHMIQWAKQIPMFCQLVIKDQIALLQAHATEHLILDLTQRSLHLNNVLLLGNSSIISKDKELTPMTCLGDGNVQVWPEVEITGFGTRILNEMVDPFKKIEVDDTEFACLKAIVFFDPNAKGLGDTARVELLRDQTQTNLEHHINDRQYTCTGRLGKLLLMLPVLQLISLEIVDKIQLAKVYNSPFVDQILLDMLVHNKYNNIP